MQADQPTKVGSFSIVRVDGTLPAVGPELITHFNEIGRLSGRYTRQAERDEEYRFWKNWGAAGATWLIQRIDTAESINQAWGIADVLASLGSAAIDPIIKSLGGTPSVEVADVLLSAIGAMSLDPVETRAEAIVGTLRLYLSHSDDAVRSKAVAATSVLPTETAIAMLRNRHHAETDADVRVAIEDEIERRS